MQVSDDVKHVGNGTYCRNKHNRAMDREDHNARLLIRAFRARVADCPIVCQPPGILMWLDQTYKTKASEPEQTKLITNQDHTKPKPTG